MESLARVFLAKLRYFGVYNDFSDIVSYDPMLVCFAAKIGLSIVESTANPADSYFIQNVSFPMFVRRYGFDSYLPAGEDIFRQSVQFLASRFPRFCRNCISWPVSIPY